MHCWSVSKQFLVENENFHILGVTNITDAHNKRPLYRWPVIANGPSAQHMICYDKQRRTILPSFHPRLLAPVPDLQGRRCTLIQQIPTSARRRALTECGETEQFWMVPPRQMHAFMRNQAHIGVPSMCPHECIRTIRGLVIILLPQTRLGQPPQSLYGPRHTKRCLSQTLWIFPRRLTS